MKRGDAAQKLLASPHVSDEARKFAERIRAFVDFEGWMAGAPVPPYALFVNAGFFRDFLDPRQISEDIGCSLAMHALRDLCIDEYGFALPCREAIEAIRDLGPLLEIGAGTGAWAAILKANGADIVATDGETAGTCTFGFRLGEHFPVEHLTGAAAVLKYPERAVLAVWPSYDEVWCTEALTKMRPGTSLALVHEGDGGCVGDDSMFAMLDGRFEEVRAIQIPQWRHIHDRLTIYVKKP